MGLSGVIGRFAFDEGGRETGFQTTVVPAQGVVVRGLGSGCTDTGFGWFRVWLSIQKRVQRYWWNKRGPTDARSADDVCGSGDARTTNKVKATMERRKFLIGAGGAAVGASALVGSGAFSSVNADRSMVVEVEGDAGAYLRLDPSSPYAAYNGDNLLELDFGDNGRGTGINDNADSEFVDVFRIENQGSQEAKVWIDLTEINNGLSSGYVTSWVSTVNCSNESGLDQDSSGDWDNSPEAIGIRLDPGEWVGVAIQFVGIDEDNPETISGTVPVRAAAEDSHVFDDVGFEYTTTCNSS